LAGVRVRAYSTSANLGVGFDALAVALDAFYDEVYVRVEEGRGRIHVDRVWGPYASEAGEASTASRAAKALLDMLGIRSLDVAIEVYKGVPVARGLGSSGATAAATVVAVAEALSASVRAEDLVLAAGEGEAAAAGQPHYDNVAASIYGGAVAVCRGVRGLRVKRIPLRSAWFSIHVPLYEVPREKTRLMRKILPESISFRDAVLQWSRVSVMVAAMASGDLEVFGEMMSLDGIVEPRRSKLVPCYKEVRDAAIKAGALGVALSGAGPSMIALAASRSEAERIAEAMRDAGSRCGDSISLAASLAGPASKV
jgi:homoserine kinase